MNNVFLKIDGVAGESRDSAHKGWIDVDSYTWGTRRKGDGIGPGKTNYHNLSVHCQAEKSTPGALLYASNGNRIKKVELSACKAGGHRLNITASRWST
ncbi:type VI secretion system tube protein Hcp [Paramixta manurensis]|uniref:Type VI secretion system tube protein Hcp n=1 Tax=Paramixta manurensis TaxID=2740817 RepID=A0A6M8U3C4_9GAMM|nr:type VI secretion system tube protein Hcp [Erwiniaceae bacterium PD-1]